jgi:hypothetical protein
MVKDSPRTTFLFGRCTADIGWRKVEVDGRDSFHLQRPMNKAM